jgi:hypothetical protein
MPCSCTIQLAGLIFCSLFLQSVFEGDLIRNWQGLHFQHLLWSVNCNYFIPNVTGKQTYSPIWKICTRLQPGCTRHRQPINKCKNLPVYIYEPNFEGYQDQFVIAIIVENITLISLTFTTVETKLSWYSSNKTCILKVPGSRRCWVAGYHYKKFIMFFPSLFGWMSRQVFEQTNNHQQIYHLMYFMLHNLCSWKCHELQHNPRISQMWTW